MREADANRSRAESRDGPMGCSVGTVDRGRTEVETQRATHVAGESLDRVEQRRNEGRRGKPDVMTQAPRGTRGRQTAARGLCVASPP